MPFGASVNEVKKAYHQLAFRYHPDKNPNNKFAEQQFLEISEAYQLLSEDAKRTNYCNAYITFLQEQQYSADNYSKPPTPREIFETKVHPDYRDIVMKHYRPVMGRASKRDMRWNSFNYSFIVIFIFISIIMSFLALKQEKETDGKELLEILKQDNKLKKYVYMLEGAEVFPILRDAENKVLALPPLINSEYSKISVNTKNVLIDITAHDETKANIVLNILVTMFSTYCKDRFTVEGVEVIDYKGNSTIYPKLEFNTFKVDIPYLN